MNRLWIPQSVDSRRAPPGRISAVFSRKANEGCLRPKMILASTKIWGTTAAVVVFASAAAGTVWWLRRHRPTIDELEQARRARLSIAGRLVDGMLLDVRELADESGGARTFLFYSYCIGGVEYECSQDITTMRAEGRATQVRAGFPCSVRYLPGSPENSIVVAEDWSGLRIEAPKFTPAPKLKDPGQVPTS